MKLFGLFLLLLVVAAGVCGFLIYVPFGPSNETFVDIPTGTSSRGMAQILQDAGVVRSQYAFEALRAVRGGRLKAGEYRFDHPTNVLEVYDRIARGDVYTIAVTIPEGFNLFDIAGAIQAAGLGSGKDFLDLAKKNTDLIAEWDPHATSLEGYLFPDTYRFSHHTTQGQMLQAMVKRFGKVMEQLGLHKGSDVSRLVTMASLVEKEVHLDTERPMVAGVFENRLRVNMPLATDPTVIYAALLAGRWRGTIYASDLQFDSPYNTYKHTGLPPGPICSPGLDSLRAVLRPAITDNLYFVADASGHTRFSTTLKEHNEQVNDYRHTTH